MLEADFGAGLSMSAVPRGLPVMGFSLKPDQAIQWSRDEGKASLGTSVLIGHTRLLPLAQASTAVVCPPARFVDLSIVNQLNAPESMKSKLLFALLLSNHEVIMAHGWENMKKMPGGYFQSAPPAAASDTCKASDTRVRINGNMAFTTEGVEANNTLSYHFYGLGKGTDGRKTVAFSGQQYQADKLAVVK